MCEQRANAIACADTAADRRDRVFRHAESRGGCATANDSAVVGQHVEELVDDVVAALATPRGTGSRCAARELFAAARAIVRYARAEATDKRSPNLTRRARAIGSLRAHLATAFAAAATTGDCPSATTSEELFGVLFDAFTGLVPKLFPEPCPCFTSERIDATFGGGYLNREGRGGAACLMDGPNVAIGTSDGCDYRPPIGAIVVSFPRAAAFASDSMCFFTNDLDSNDNGTCEGIPQLNPITPAQGVGCAAAIKGSSLYRRECE